MLKFKLMRVMPLLFCATSYAAPEQITLESSTLLEFTQLVSDIVKRPVLVSANLDTPFSINATFNSDKQLLDLLHSSIVSSGFSFDSKGRAIVISEYGFLDSPELITKTYFLNHLPSNQAYKLFKSLFSSQAFRLNRSVTPGTPGVSNLKSAKNNRKTQINNKAPSVVDSASNNALVISATKNQHINVAEIIKTIDSPRRQVLIEAVISELSDSDFEGLDTKLEYTRGLDSIASDLQTFRPDTGLAIKLINSKSLKFYLDYIESTDNSKILSKPKVVTLDRERASVIVGQNVPFVTGQSTSQASDTNNPFQTIQRVDIGLKLKVTPVVTPSGLIELTIYQETSSVNNNTVASDIVTNVRSFTSKVLLKDGHSVVLGGLISKTEDKGHSGSIPFISDLPLIGRLFSSHTENFKNMNLVVMISAKIIQAGHSLPDAGGRLGMTPLEIMPHDVLVTHHK